MGPGPVGVLVEAAVIAAVWALMTWPWTVSGTHAHPAATAAGGRGRAGSGQQLDLGQPQRAGRGGDHQSVITTDRKSTRLNSSHVAISYAVFCLKKKNVLDSRERAPTIETYQPHAPIPDSR